MLSNTIEDILGKKITNLSAVSGGCIATTQKITCADGSAYFMKSGGTAGMFIKEANGLREIAKSATITVPEVLGVGEDFLLLSYIMSGSRSRDFYEKFAIAYAQMHRYKAEYYGFYEDNFIGNTVQKNIPKGEEVDNWPLFYFNKRLKFQFDLAEANAYIDPNFRRLFSKLENRIDRIIPPSIDGPSLLHGDLWGGNYMHNAQGEAVLIDPAVYYGDREADLAMTKIFGGFPPEFYKTYNETFPLNPGWEYRENIYKLYHILNHLNLFGTSYLSEAHTLIRCYVN